MSPAASAAVAATAFATMQPGFAVCFFVVRGFVMCTVFTALKIFPWKAVDGNHRRATEDECGYVAGSLLALLLQILWLLALIVRKHPTLVGARGDE